MGDKINDIIERYKGYAELYEVLKKEHLETEISEEKYNETILKIKKKIISYYLYKYQFNTYPNNEKHDKILIKIFEICNLEKKIKKIEGKIKVYPVKESDENKEKIYKKIIIKMVDYQLETNKHIEDIFDEYWNLLDNKLKEYKQQLKNQDMYLYYGSPYYMIERAKYISYCIKFIPNISLNIDDLINPMISFEKKYISDRNSFTKEEDFIVESDEFYKDYDLLESCYKKLLVMENELAPTVIDYWKRYLTDPNKHSDNYRYITHSFSEGMIAPNIMNKACCSLSTNEIENVSLGSSGLVYDLDAESVETMCTYDVGSWVLNKDKFIECGCQGTWQLTELNEQTVFYEYPRNSKLIMPELFEKEYRERILNGDTWYYSEIFLNNKAKAVGVFYVDGCKNIEEVKEYAEKYKLPLVKVSVKNYSNTNKKN